MASQQQDGDEGNPEMIIVYGLLSAGWCVIGILIGLSI
jgi:hypothetical protein